LKEQPLLATDRISDLQALYKRAKLHFDSDELFKHAAHRQVVALQGGDATALATWRAICAV
jgi:arginyl-tRNA synthetase